MTTSESTNSASQQEGGNRSTGIAQFVPMLKEHGPMVYAFLVASLYVCGFLVLNAHLAKYGVEDYEFIDARYFLAGASFTFFLVCFYLFAGRAVLNMPQWVQEDVGYFHKIGAHPSWFIIAFLHSLVSAAFSCCLSAALFSFAAFGNFETAFFYAVLAGAFFILYTFDITNLDIKFPRTHLIISLAVKVIAIIAFFSNIGTGMLLTVFSLYVALFVFINLVLDSLTRHGATSDRISYSTIYAAVILLTIALAYGSLSFGNVTPKIGGARPQQILVALSKEASEMIPTELKQTTGKPLSGKLVYQTEKHIYVDIAGKTARFRTADVVALVVSPEQEQNFWTEFAQKSAQAVSSPTPSLKETTAPIAK